MSWNTFGKTLGLVCSALILASACSPSNEVDENVSAATESSTISQPDVSLVESAINIQNGIIRPPLGGKTVTAGYFTMVLGQDDRIISVSSDVAETIELHTHEMSDGMMQMRKVEGVDVKAGVPVVFEPKGLHLMIFGVNDVKEGDTADVTFTFESGRTASALFTVSTPDVSKDAGHKH